MSNLAASDLTFFSQPAEPAATDTGTTESKGAEADRMSSE
jgi:hypothetical protein